MLWKSQEPHLWKRQSNSLEDTECSSLHIPMDQGDLRCTRVHSQQEHCSQRSQARQHSGRLTNANKPKRHSGQKHGAWIQLSPNCRSIFRNWTSTRVGSDFRTFPWFFVVNMGDFRGDFVRKILEENSVLLAFRVLQLPQNADIDLKRLCLLSPIV